MFSVRIFGVRRTQGNLQAKRGKLANFTDPHRQAAVLVFKFIQDNFAADGALAESGGWRPLAPSTILRRRKGAGIGSPLILRDTGALRSRWLVNGDRRRGLVRSGVDYAREHHEGRGGKPPQRKLLPSERQLSDLVRPVFKRHVRVSIR